MTSPVGVSQPVSTPAPSRRFGRVRRLRSALGLVALALLATACGSDPGTREDFIDVMTQDGVFTVEQATCMADAVFDRYGEDDDALGKISAADSFEFFDEEENGIPGFSEFFDETVQSCAPVGPTSG